MNNTKIPNKEVTTSRYKNFCKKYDVKAVCAFLSGFTCYTLACILFKCVDETTLLDTIINLIFCLSLGVLSGLSGVEFSKIMYSE